VGYLLTVFTKRHALMPSDAFQDALVLLIHW